MNIKTNILSRRKSSGFLIFLMFLCAYFSYFAIKGDRGFLKYMYLENKVIEAEQLSESYSRQRADLEEKVKLLSANSLDLDLLDERARMVLNVIGDDEFIIFDEDSDISE